MRGCVVASRRALPAQRAGAQGVVNSLADAGGAAGKIGRSLVAPVRRALSSANVELVRHTEMCTQFLMGVGGPDGMNLPRAVVRVKRRRTPRDPVRSTPCRRARATLRCGRRLMAACRADRQVAGFRGRNSGKPLLAGVGPEPRRHELGWRPLSGAGVCRARCGVRRETNGATPWRHPRPSSHDGCLDPYIDRSPSAQQRRGRRACPPQSCAPTPEGYCITVWGQDVASARARD